MAKYDLLITGGNLIDAAEGIDARRDVAFANGKVAAVAEHIDRGDAAESIDASGMIVSPGLIDAHVHVYEGVSHYGINADDTCLPFGATTVIDAGSAGYDTFRGFRKYVIEASATRILAHVNISSMGMISGEIGELDDIKWASVSKALQAIEANRDVVLGVKVRLTRGSLVGYEAGLKPLFMAREAADAAGLPIMVHPQDSWAESLDDVLAVMRNGDMMTHMYHGMRHGILDDEGKIRASVQAARDRGVIFDVGHGAGSFDWEVCEKAMAQEFEPTTISSDLHTHNVHGPVYDLVTTVSKFLMLGMSLHDALAKVTSIPANVAVGNHTGIGTLAPGSEGDAVLLEMEEGDFTFHDSRWVARRGTSRLAVRGVIKAGVVVQNGAGVH